MMKIKDRWLLMLLLLAVTTAAAAAGQPTGAIDEQQLEARRTMRAEIERLAIDIAIDSIFAPDRYEVISARFNGASPLSTEVLSNGEWIVDRIDGPNRSGTIQVRFNALWQGDVVGEANASVRGILYGPALVARTTLTRGDVIAPGEVEITETDLTRLSDPPLRSRSALIGFVPERSIAEGRPLTASMLRVIPIVRRGDLVLLVAKRGTLTVTARAKALGDGGVGETIAAENLRSGSRLQAEVQPDGSLRVMAGSSLGARNR